MKGKLVIDGNSVYELDEECIRKKREQEMIDNMMTFVQMFSTYGTLFT